MIFYFYARGYSNPYRLQAQDILVNMIKFAHLL
jgi:hypothetical protein